jgi:hypothetical protein
VVIENFEKELKLADIKDYKIKSLPDESFIINVELNKRESLDSISDLLNKISKLFIQKFYTYTSKVSVVVDYLTQKQILSFELKKVVSRPVTTTYTRGTGYNEPRNRNNRDLRHTGPKVQVITENEADLLFTELKYSNFYGREVNHITRVIRDRIPPDENIVKNPSPVEDAINKDSSRYWTTDYRLIEIFKFEGAKFIVRYLSIGQPKIYYFCRGVEEIRRIDFTK